MALDPEGDLTIRYDPPKIPVFNAQSAFSSFEQKFGAWREGIKPEIKSMMIIEEYSDLITPNYHKRKISDNFWMTVPAIFLSNPENPSNEESEDVEMEDAREESKIDTIKLTLEPLKSESEIQHKHWEINIREKLNLRNYTRRYSTGKIRNKGKKSNTSLAAISNLQKIMNPVEADKIMKDINLEKDFELDYPELLTKYEFPAVLRLKKKFMVWF